MLWYGEYLDCVASIEWFDKQGCNINLSILEWNLAMFTNNNKKIKKSWIEMKYFINNNKYIQ